MSLSDPCTIPFRLKHDNKLLSIVECKLLSDHSESVVIKIPGGRIRLAREWLLKNSVIHAEELQDWVARLEVAATQRLVPLKDPVTDYSGLCVSGKIDLLVRASEPTQECERLEDDYCLREVTLWIPMHAIWKVSETDVRADWHMINRILEATTRQPLDLDPASPVPFYRGSCPMPKTTPAYVSDFGIALRNEFDDLGVPAFFEEIF